MRVALHPAAERDIEKAAKFYEREGSALLASGRTTVRQERGNCGLPTALPMSMSIPAALGWARGMAACVVDRSFPSMVFADTLAERDGLSIQSNGRRRSLSAVSTLKMR